MKTLQVLKKIVDDLDNPRFKNERQLIKLMGEILNIHNELFGKKKIDRKIKRRIKKVFGYGLPYDLYQQLGLYNALEERHIKLLMEQ